MPTEVTIGRDVFTVEANDDVIVSIVRDLGKGSAPYARVHHISRKIEIIAPLPEPKAG